MKSLGTVELIVIIALCVCMAYDLFSLPLKELTWRDRVTFCMLVIIALLVSQ